MQTWCVCVMFVCVCRGYDDMRVCMYTCMRVKLTLNARACVCVVACVHALCVCVRLCARVLVCVFVCVRVRVCVWLRVFVCACVRELCLSCVCVAVLFIVNVHVCV